jgi:hypothetical protein
VTVRRRIKWIIVVCALALAFFAFTRTSAGIAVLKSRSHFIESDVDARVRYEPGAEAMGTAIATYLPEAIAHIEAVHGRPFAKPVNVYVCATQGSFNEYTAAPSQGGARGSALADAWIAPRAFSFHGVDTHRGSLKHELSHLHVRQRLGFVRTKANVPTWFHEGLANIASGVGGETVADDQAIEAILADYRLVPDDVGSFWRMTNVNDYGMDFHMVHAQSRLFTSYLHDADPEVFREFVIRVEDGESFANSFRNAFGADVATAWGEFVASLEERFELE